MTGLQCFVIGIALFAISVTYDLTPTQTFFATGGAILWVCLAVAKRYAE